MEVKLGMVWVGLLAVMNMRWADGMYRFEGVVNVCDSPSLNQQPVIRQPPSAYRMLVIKGGFRRNDSRENIGVKLLTN